ncbi:MAG: trimethylamine methyltransferase family protein [Desulfobacterales bacterium]|nr:trimethylamine methyltransferase family protein [Desulfobacterales bacterium]
MKRNLHAGKNLNGGLKFSVFTDDELLEIHMATLEVLQKTGVFVEDTEALQLFADNGAVIDEEKKIVKIPPFMVEEAIQSAPSKVLLAGRNPKNDIVLETNRVGFTNFGEGIVIKDPDTGELREPTKKDVANTARLVDAMSEIDVYERACGAHEVPQDVVSLHNAEAFFANTSKHCFLGPGSGFLANKIADMAEVIVGGKDKLKQQPIVSFITCPVSPLRLANDTCEIIMTAAKRDLACNILSMAMAGGSSPVTLAGTLVSHNAEILSGIVLSQLTKKGAAVIYGSSTTAMDLRMAAASVGSPECALISAGVAQLSTYYLLPSWVAGG